MIFWGIKCPVDELKHEERRLYRPSDWETVSCNLSSNNVVLQIEKCLNFACCTSECWHPFSPCWSPYIFYGNSGENLLKYPKKTQYLYFLIDDDCLNSSYLYIFDYLTNKNKNYPVSKHNCGKGKTISRPYSLPAEYVKLSMDLLKAT